MMPPPILWDLIVAAAVAVGPAAGSDPPVHWTQPAGPAPVATGDPATPGGGPPPVGSAPIVNGTSQPGGPAVAPLFHEIPGGPVIRMGDAVPNLLWNDPDVIDDDGVLRMWLTGGDPRDGARTAVRVYEATSADGQHWTIHPVPVLAPSPDPSAWDSARVETPSVVKVGPVYHMYYAGADTAGAAQGVYAIGHATSLDGRTWVKDSRNPVLRAQHARPSEWGYRGVGEPDVVFDPITRTFFLYYTSMQFPEMHPSNGHIGLMVATSVDGVTFHPVLDSEGRPATLLTREVQGATPGSWFGYTAPSVTILGNGNAHLVCSFIVAPAGPTSARHVTLTQAVSQDLVNFRVVAEDFVRAGTGDWKDHQVRSPSLLEVGERLALWYAGESLTPYFSAGIGFAVTE